MSKIETPLDVVTIGRSSVDLYGEQVGGRLEDMRSFAKYVGGCPANIAIGASRLGLNSAIITAVGADHMGRFIKEQLAREGVNVEGVKEDADRLTALVILGIRDQEQFPLIFYRENCADMAIGPEDISSDLIQSSKSLLISGTHLSKPLVLKASLKAVNVAKKAGIKVILDIDYRPVLWGLTDPDRGEDRFIEDTNVTKRLQSVAPDCDLIVGTEEELHILGGTTDTLDAIRNVRKISSATIVCKLGAYGCVVFEDDIPGSLMDGVVGKGFPVEVFNVLGAGDAFLSGFLRGWLRSMSIEQCCQLANASGAIVVSRHGCAPAIPTWTELQHFIKTWSEKADVRTDPKIAHIHWATTRDRNYEGDISVFAIDHRSQLTDLANETGVGEDKIVELKNIAYEVLHKIGGNDPSYGMLLDGRFGSEALAVSADHPYWIARPVELPGSRPLQFEHQGDIAVDIKSWPSIVIVKCLVFYHPDDSKQMREQQEEQLLRLFDACRDSEHELLIEIIASKHGKVDSTTISTIIRRFYNIGLYPDWWKLEPLEGNAAWNNVELAISSNDPYCRGIVILGLAAHEDALIESFEVSAKYDLVKGFAIGRTIFHVPAKEWFEGKITNQELKQKLSQNFQRLITGWRTARARAREKVQSPIAEIAK